LFWKQVQPGSKTSAIKGQTLLSLSLGREVLPVATVLAE